MNPVNHTRAASTVAVYKMEPYVVAADVYAVPPHTGRGGWTWYMGSAAMGPFTSAWMEKSSKIIPSPFLTIVRNTGLR